MDLFCAWCACAYIAGAGDNIEKSDPCPPHVSTHSARVRAGALVSAVSRAGSLGTHTGASL